VEWTNEIACPLKCSGRSLSDVTHVSMRDVGITPGIATAANLIPEDELLTCVSCGCVWRECYDPFQSRYRSEILGTYSGSVFRPEPWVEKAACELREASA
jgi:hypothetical protein